MKLKILTPDKLVLDQEVDSVTLPGSEGEMTILPDHAAMVATLKKGTLRYRLGGGKAPSEFLMEGGFVEVLKNQVRVMTKSSQTREANLSRH